MPANNLKRFVMAGALFLLLLCDPALADDNSAETADSTLIRQTEPPSKTLGEKILAVPQFILHIPVRVLELPFKFIYNDIVATKFSAGVYKGVDKLHRIWGFYPVLGYGANQGIKGGIGFKSKGAFTVEERLKLKATYSTHDYQRYKVEYLMPHLLGAYGGVRFHFSYEKRPWESFYGLGPETEESDEVTYTSENTYFRLGGLWDLGRGTRLDITGEHRISNLYDGRDPAHEGDLDVIRENLNLSPADLAAARVWSVAAAMTHDWRDSRLQPSRGGVEILSLSYHKGSDRSENLEYISTSLDLRYYLEIYKKRLFALRVMARTIDTQNDSPEIPFYLRSQLGGYERLRGYRESRFIDNDVALATLEYRYPLSRKFDAFVFVDEARVFSDIFDEFTLSKWQYSFGGGLRLWGIESTVFSLQVASSEEDLLFYFELAEDF